MPTPAQPSDAIDAIFGNPILKGAMAGLGAVAAITRYIKESNERWARSSIIANRYELRGPIFFSIARFPYALHMTVAIGILVIAFLEVCVLVDQYTLNRAVVSSLPTRVQGFFNAFSLYFVPLVLAALFFWLLFELRLIERFLAWLIGLVPGWRNTLGWANAQWQISGTEDERRVLAPSRPQVDAMASRLIDEITKEQRNESLALRPATLSEDSAANVLYFGHVIEQYLSATGGARPWTKFYEALAAVAETQAAPFSPEGFEEVTSSASFFPVILGANAYLTDYREYIPNDATLEEAVETARELLRDRYQSDARKMASGFLHTTYARVLGASASFLSRESMRRQFAKLFILWNITPSATRPKIFRIPFSSRMFMQYLDANVLLREGDHFNTTSAPVQICFEATQKQILSRVLALLTETKDAARSQWREREKADIKSRHIDWQWWVYYRADQQSYHDARDYESKNWKVEGSEIVSK
jgi:hypothetical protein